MTLALLLAYVARALLAVVLARRCPALRPVALGCVLLAALDVPASWGPPWLRAGACVAWPAAPLAMAAWGPTRGATGCTAEAAGRRWPARKLPHAIALVYLLAGALAAASYGPAHAVYVGALLASRWGAVLVLAALVYRHGRPRTALSLAASIPAIGLACGVAAGAWPLAQDGGLAAVARGWGLARAETWAALGLQALAMVWASGRRVRDAGPTDP